MDNERAPWSDSDCFDDDDGGLMDPLNPSLQIVGCIGSNRAPRHRRRSRSVA